MMDRIELIIELMSLIKEYADIPDDALALLELEQEIETLLDRYEEVCDE